MSKGTFVDLYELTMAQVYFKYKRGVSATFDLFIRSSNRPFYVACGIDDVLNHLQEVRFTKEDVDYLRSLSLFDDDFLEYLRDFRFKGEVWGVDEPEIVFAQEPILRVTGSLIEVQIVESALLNKINLATTLATKSARVVLSAQGRGVYDFSLRRTQGKEASLACAKYSYITGARGTSNVYAGFLYGVPVVGTMAHSFVMSFDREIESFIAFARTFPAKSILLVDTYNVKEGVKSAVKVARFLRKNNVKLLGIRLDSGNLIEDSKNARHALDKEGLIDTFIFASGNLDEYRINELISQKAPIDAFGVGTNMGCSSDLPFSDVIYKLVEIKDKGRDFMPTMKLSENKTTLPSRKQVFRDFDKNGMICKDTIALDSEKAGGTKILKKLMANGNRLYKEKNLEEKRNTFLKRTKSLPYSLRRIDSKYKFPVDISKKLSLMVKDIRKQLVKRGAPRAIFMDVDTQHDFIDKKGCLSVPDACRLIPNLKKLTDFARKNNILIISSQDTHHKKDPEFSEFPPHCIKDSRGHKKINQTSLSKAKVLTYKKVYSSGDLRKFIHEHPQIILEKNVLNVFSNPNTLNLLETLFPDKVYIYGVVTDYCVKEAVEGVMRLGIPVAIIKDAVKEISSKEKQRLFSIWRNEGVEFVATEQVLKRLSAKE